MVPRHDQPGQPFVGRLDPPMAQRGEEPGQDAHPVTPEEDQQRGGGGHMQAHDEREVGRFGGGDAEILRPSPADQRRHQHRVPQAGDREQLGDALERADHHGLDIAQVRGHSDASMRRRSGGADRPVTIADAAPPRPRDTAPGQSRWRTRRISLPTGHFGRHGGRSAQGTPTAQRPDQAGTVSRWPTGCSMPCASSTCRAASPTRSPACSPTWVPTF